MKTYYQKNEAEIRVMNHSASYNKEVRPELSILMPTYKRLDVLALTLKALMKQSLAKERFEVVVVDDGSADETELLLEQTAYNTELQFTYLVLAENGGPARARNFGLRQCRGEVILIIGDDIEATSSLAATHLELHKNNSANEYAVLGHVSFPQRPRPSLFMQWLEEGGRTFFFNYKDLVAGEEASPLFFYTCNVSVKKGLFAKSGWFDESFPYASHEDLELGYRLKEQGMRLVYQPEAAGYHHHQLSIDGIRRRIYLMGYSAELFWQKVNERGGIIRKMARNLLTFLAASPVGVMVWRRLREKNYRQDVPYPGHWKLLLSLSFFIGLSDAKNDRKPRV